MESSTVLAFRIFVMLSCLIIVPMAAIFGSAFPDVVKTQLVDRIVSWSTGKEPEANPAPAAGAVSTTMPAAAQSPGGQQWEAPRWGAPEGESSWSPPPSRVVPAGGVTARPSPNRPAGFSAPPDTGQAYPPPAAMQPQGESAYGAAPGRIPVPDRAACPLDQPQKFTALERKLREYGATYYLLETLGNDGGHYRFFCRMAIGNNPNYTRDFEASDRDALEAMSQVLARVESWRSGRTP